MSLHLVKLTGIWIGPCVWRKRLWRHLRYKEETFRWSWHGEPSSYIDDTNFFRNPYSSFVWPMGFYIGVHVWPHPEYASSVGSAHLLENLQMSYPERFWGAVILLGYLIKDFQHRSRTLASTDMAQQSTGRRNGLQKNFYFRLSNIYMEPFATECRQRGSIYMKIGRSLETKWEKLHETTQTGDPERFEEAL